LVLLLMGFYLLKATDSKSSLVCLLFGLTLILGSRWFASKGVATVALLLALSSPFLLLLTQQYSEFFTPLFNALGRDVTFTGRTDIWNHITFSTVNPIFGAGFYNFWGGPGGQAIRDAMQTPVPNAHNGYLDTFLDGGIIGVALLFLLLAASGIRLLNNLRGSRYYQVRFALLLVAIVGGCTESNFGRLSLLWFATMLALVEFPSQKAGDKILPPQVEAEPGFGLDEETIEAF